MADFCKQCSLFYFEADTQDLADLRPKPSIIDVDDPFYNCYEAFCEKCGPVIVDFTGKRMDSENWKPPY